MNAIQIFMEANWWIPAVAVSVYTAALAAAPRGSDTPFRRSAFVVWNAALSAASAVLLLLIGTSVASSVASIGLEEELCDDAVEHTVPMAVFCIMKLPELLDTVGLLARGKPVRALHAWHHVTVALYCWSAYVVAAPAGSVYAVINCAIHTWMYAHYAIMCSGWTGMKARAVRWARWLTRAQIAQMWVGIATTLYARGCTRDEALSNNTAALLMYASYLALFVHFYTQRYGRK